MSLDSGIYNWLTSVSGLPVWQAPVDSGVDISGDYLTFQLVNIVSSDFNSYEDGNVTTNDFTRTIRNKAEIFLSVNCWVGRQSANEPYEVLTRLQHSESFPDAVNVLNDDNLAINRMGRIQDLTGLGDTNFRRRSQLDIEFLADIETKWQWDRLNEWKLTGLISNENYEITGTINYP